MNPRPRRPADLPGPFVRALLLAGALPLLPLAAGPRAVTFTPGAPIDLGGPDTRALIAADLDGDGHMDLAATLFRDTEDDGLAVLFGDGSGGFPRRTSFAAGFRAYGLASGDFNGDGLPDLVSTEGTQIKPYPRPPCGVPISVPVFLNHPPPAGSFSWDACLTTGAFPIAPATADFNGDGFLDLAVADNAGDDVTVFLGRGDGTFSAGTSTGPLATGPTSLVAGDFDGDGIADLALGHQDGFVGHGITVLLGRGDGSFSVKQSVASGSAVQALRAADLNGDGRLDLVAADKGGGKVWVCLGRGDGTFSSGVSSAAGTYPNDLAIADFNGDGRPDAVTANSGSDDATLLLGRGDGAFEPGGVLAAGHEPQGVVAADFNGDGFPDFAVSSRNAGEQGSAIVFLQTPRPPAIPGDCDGDGAVSIGEVQRAIAMYLGLQPVACGADCNADGAVSIGEVQKVINGFLGMAGGC
jgi:hypothetical protein